MAGGSQGHVPAGSNHPPVLCCNTCTHVWAATPPWGEITFALTSLSFQSSVEGTQAGGRRGLSLIQDHRKILVLGCGSFVQCIAQDPMRGK